MSFAVEGRLSESLAQEVGPLGIRVVLISPSGFAIDWAGNSAAETLPDSEIADYSDTAGAYRRNFRANAGKEAGDPKRAAVAIVDVAHDDAPPATATVGKLRVRRPIPYGPDAPACSVSALVRGCKSFI